MEDYRYDKIFNKKIKLILLVLILACSGFVVKAEEQNLPQSPILQTKDMKDGVILHAWGWSFKAISENMEKIKNAGYTSIQTSPINKVIEGKNGDLSFENWYFHYQPAAYTIGNYQLGSEADFIEMNKIAEQHGIRIIVDVVLNHTTTNEALHLVSDDIKNIPNWTHGNAGILEGLKHKSIPTGNIMNFNINVAPNKLVTWVESHDNYANTSKESVWMSDTYIILGWALVAGRFQGTPLFFSRPKGGGEPVQFDATMRLGSAGSDFILSPNN